MWDFEVKKGIDFKHCNRVHPLMQGRVQQLLQELKKDGNIRKIVLFGSSLEFRCSSNSDIDLYIEKIDCNKPFVKEPVLDCEVDILADLDHNSRLYRQIDQTGLILYERGSDDV
ncbi:MAG: nucleotidyltransferase domain-containing protein [Eubacterium sp.]|nr:nucleotidyltransferase domain-containing protein [Eubacterium sp.]